MLVKRLDECTEITAGDNTTLRELLNPSVEPLDINYSLAHARLKQGQASLPHWLKASEVYYILKGEGLMHIDNESGYVGKGHVIVIPAGTVQYIENTGTSELKFLCIVEPPWTKDMEKILKKPTENLLCTI